MKLGELNILPVEVAGSALLHCCGSARWAARMLAARPFETIESLHTRATAEWLALSKEDWLEAFARHPKIGEKSSSKWSAQEQKGMAGSTATAAQAMREANVRYERKFGWTFIICATGKTAEEMLASVEKRIGNDSETELNLAAAEQAQIMHLRIDKLLAE